MRKVVVGMSGGVDSSVAAWLLKQQGYEVLGLFMKNWEDDDNAEYCSTRQDWLDAVSVADVLGIDIEAVNFSREYKERVFALFLQEYQAGRTPNPDVLCNAEIKFAAFLDHALALGADWIATGHYARTRVVATPGKNSRVELLKAIDNSKDQSYFLHRLNQRQLARTLFPVGELHKSQVREIAAQLQLPNATKKDSTGICFIGERPFREFLSRYLHHQPGPMKTPEGVTVGEHIGLGFYTLGQRKGIGLGGLKSYPSPQSPADDHTNTAWYVAKKDIKNNTLYVVQGASHPWLFSTVLESDQMSWISGAAPEVPEVPVFTASTRYRQVPAECGYQMLESEKNDVFSLIFSTPQWAVTPGQSAVLYQGEVCLGGGIIRAMDTENS